MKKSFLSILFALALCLSLTCVAGAAEPSGDALTAQTLSDSSYTLSGGSYYLADDLTITQTIKVTGTVTLDLKGHVLKLNSSIYGGTASGSVIEIVSGGKLTLEDSDSTAKHYFYARSDSDLWRWDADATTMPADTAERTYHTVTGGVITGGSKIDGGGIYIWNGSSTGPAAELSMHGGSIVGCTAVYGGGVYVGNDNAKFTMESGSIAGCAASSEGGGVYVYNAAFFTMDDGSIHDCVCPRLQEKSYYGRGGGVSNHGTFVMTGGRIENCRVYTKTQTLTDPAAEGGGGIYSIGTFTMSGGKLVDCSTEEGGKGDGILLGGTMTLEDVVSTGYGLKIGDGWVDLNVQFCGNVACSCHHSLGSDGKCPTCKVEMKASVTVGTGESAVTSYYASLSDALAAANKASGETAVKALKEGGNSAAELTISRSMTFDMNGKTICMGTLDITGSGTVVTIQNTVTTTEVKKLFGMLNVNGGSKLKVASGQLANTVTVKSGGSAEITGGTLEILIVDAGGSAELSGGTFTQITNSNEGKSVQDLLKADYAYRQYEGTAATGWYCDKESTVSGKTLVVEAVPIKSVIITNEDDTKTHNPTDNNNAVLHAEATGAAEGASVTYRWYKSTNGGTPELIDDYATNEDCTLNKPITWDAGTYKFTCTATVDGYTVTSNTCTFTITKMEIGGYTAPTAKDTMTYNGGEQTLVNAGSVPDSKGTVQYKLGENGTWSADIPTAKNAATYTVYWQIVGETNYQDITDTTPLTATIAPFDISNSTSDSIPYFKAVCSEVPFDGTQKTLEPEFKLMASSASDADVLAALVEGTDYTISGDLSGTDIGAYSFTIIAAAGSNYTGSHTYYWNIVKGAKPTLPNINVNAKYSDSSVTVQVDQLLRGMPANAGALTFRTIGHSKTGSVTLDSYSVDGGKVIVSFSNGAAGDTITLYNMMVTSENYKDAAFDVVITLTDKNSQAALTITSANTATYRTSLQLMTSGGSGSGQVSWSVVNGTGSAVLNDDRLFPTKVGTVTVMATKAGDSTHNEVYSAPMTITIGKLQFSGEPRYTLITTSGKTLADATLRNNESWYKVSASIGWVDEDGNSLPDSTPVQPNTEYRWRFTVDEMDADGCEPTTLTGTVILWTRSSGGSSSGSTSTTVRNPDGSTTTTTTNKRTGEVTETTRTPNGVTGTTVTDKNGNVTNISASIPASAAKSGETIALPINEVKPGNGTTIDVSVPAGGATVEIPVKDPTPGTVVVIVNSDGSETIVSSSKVTENGIEVTLEKSVTLKIVDGSKRFGDVKDVDFFRDAVQWASSRGITGGIGDGKFGPHLSTERAQLVTFLWRAAGCPVVNFAMDFSDVDEESFYGEAVRWAASLGIVGGYGNGAFGTNDAITREQMAVILYRFAQAVGMDTTQGGMAAREFADYESVADYAREAMQWAVGAGIIQGADGKLLPGDVCTRGQIVTMLYRLLGK